MYKFNDDTLMHGIGFNPSKLEGILKFGIISENFAKDNAISYNRNYNFTLSNEMLDKVGNDININKMIEEANKNNIYLVRNLYVSDDPLSAYNMYIRNGISFIVEDVPFIFDKNVELIKRSDEVVVKNNISKDKIKMIMIPSFYKDKKINEVNMLLGNILNYNLIKSNVIGIIKYLEDYDYHIDLDEIAYLLKDLNVAFSSLNSMKKDDPEYNDAMLDYKDIIKDIDSLLSEGVYMMFSSLLNKDATVMDMVDYINSKYDNKDIIIMDSSKGRVK